MWIHIRSRRPKPSGFSLIEVVLAIAIIAVALVAILGVFPTGLSSTRASTDDTRAAALANAVFATIEAQTATFSNVDCYGTTLDLTNLTTADTKTLYVSYPSLTEPTISNDPALADWIYRIEMKFDNDPIITASGTKLGSGKLNKIQLRIRGKSSADGFVEVFHVVRNRG